MDVDRDFRVSLDDMLEALERIMEYVDGVSEQEFDKNTEKQDAVIRRIEVLGEFTMLTRFFSISPLHKTYFRRV